MKTVLITGATGSVGSAVTEALARDRGPFTEIVATDIRLPETRRAGVSYRVLDVTDDLGDALAGVHTVIHLAAVVSPPPGDSRARQHAVDVGGTENVLRACVAAGVAKLVYTSSGAAYGYTPDNPALLDEDDPLRGDASFPYALHKREAEALLARWRAEHPGLQQLVFRPCTVLGPDVHSPITALFERRVVVGLRDVDSPFCFVSADDVATAIAAGARGDATGTWNLAGEGAMTLREIAAAMGRPYVALPEPLLRRALSVLHRRGWSRFGPEATRFLAHRPVLSGRRIQRELGVQLSSSREAFESYRRARASR